MSEHLLDTEELLYLAVQATQSKQHKKAISYLKEAIAIDSSNAKAYFLLGAEYAEIHLYWRALEALEKALQLDPNLHLAKFQIGILYLTEGREAESLAIWQQMMAEQSPDSALYHFAKGVSMLINNQLTDCVPVLQKGIELNNSNQSLNRSMERFIQGINAYQQEEDAEIVRENNSDDKTSLLLSAYKKNN